MKSVPLLDAGGGGRPEAVDPEEGRLLQLVLRGAVAGSPAYAAATAQLCLLVELQGLGVTLEPSAVQTVGGLALRLVQRLEQMASGMEPILPQPPKDGEHTLAFEPSAAATGAGGALRAELGGAEPLPAAAVAEPALGAAGGEAKLRTGPQTFLFFSPGAAAPAAHGEGFVYEAARSVPPPVVTVCEAARRQALRELKSREARHASVSREAREDRKRQRERARLEAMEAARRRILRTKAVFEISWHVPELALRLCDQSGRAQAATDGGGSGGGAASAMLCEVRLGGHQARLLFRDDGLRLAYEGSLIVHSLSVLAPDPGVGAAPGAAAPPRPLVTRLPLPEEADAARPLAAGHATTSDEPADGGFTRNVAAVSRARQAAGKPAGPPASPPSGGNPESAVGRWLRAPAPPGPGSAPASRPLAVLARAYNGPPTATEALLDGSACWTWRPRLREEPVGRSGEVEPPLLALRARTLDAASAAHVGYEAEAALALRPLRVVLLLPLLVKVHACAIASMGGFREAVDRAAGTAAETAADAVVREVGAVTRERGGDVMPLVRLHVRLHGPLLVLPSPVVPRAAVLLRLGDLHVHNEFERKARTRARAGAPAVYERVQVSNGKAFQRAGERDQSLSARRVCRRVAGAAVQIAAAGSRRRQPGARRGV